MEDAIQAKISPPISVCLLDARRAVQFVRLHAAEWNLDPQQDRGGQTGPERTSFISPPNANGEDDGEVRGQHCPAN